MINAIIVENEPHHSNYLRELLTGSDKKVNLLTVCTSIADAMDAINTLKPELLFLDIDLDDGENGFDLLRKFEQPEFAVIFTTQHNTTHNAISAIRACALDFLPKPLSASELNEALQRYNKADNVAQTRSLKTNIESASGQVQFIWIKSTEDKTRLTVSDILYAESNNVWTSFYLINSVNRKTIFTSSQSIKEWERNLSQSDIVRVHNEYLVNLMHVNKYSSKISGSAELTLRSGVKIPVSKSRKNDVKALLKLRK